MNRIGEAYTKPRHVVWIQWDDDQSNTQEVRDFCGVIGPNASLNGIPGDVFVYYQDTDQIEAFSPDEFFEVFEKTLRAVPATFPVEKGETE